MILCGRDKTQKKTYMLKDILEKFEAGTFDKNHPLQRRSGRWPKDYKSGLITTVLRNEDFDPIKLCEQIFDDSFKLWLIDGLQRLTVLQSYKNDEFAINPDQNFSIVYYQDEKTLKTVEYDLRKKRYSQLPIELQKVFDGYNVDIVKHLDCTNKEIAYHMIRYNNNTAMNVNEKNFTYMLNMAEAIKNLSKKNRFFADCGDYKEPEKTKGVLERVVMESMMLLFHFDCWSKGKKMNIYLDENASDAEIGAFEGELNRLTQIIDKETTGKLFNSKNSFIWFGAFHKFVEYGLDDNRFADFLVEFQDHLHSQPFAEYDGENFDTYDANKGTKDKKVVSIKLDMIEKLMKRFLGLETPEETIEVKEEPVAKSENIQPEVENNKSEEIQEPSIEAIEEETVEEQYTDSETDHQQETEKLLEFIQKEADPEAEIDDIELYDDIAYNDISVDSGINNAGRTVVDALLAYSFKIERDKEFLTWANQICKAGRTYSQSDKINFVYLKREFDTYVDGLSKDDDKKAEVA